MCYGITANIESQKREASYPIEYIMNRSGLYRSIYNASNAHTRRDPTNEEGKSLTL